MEGSISVWYKEFIYRHSRKIISLGILGFVFLIFILINPQWYFGGEDFVQLFRCYKVRSVKDFLDFFIHGSLDSYRSLLHPFESMRQTFFSVYYRPFCLVLYFFEYSLFGLNAYMHFMFLIFFHSVITSIFCYFIIPFTGNFFAILFSLFYAFHPSFYSIGKWDYQQHIFATFFVILAVVFLLKTIINSNKKIALPLLAYLFFFFSLCTRETFIVFPLLAVLIMNLYEQSQYYKLSKINVQFKILLGFIFTFLIYCFFRQMAYPIVFSSSGTTSFLYSIITRYLTTDTIYSLYIYFLACFHPLYSVHYIFDQHKFLWFYRLIKIFTLSIPLILFVTSTQKKIILLFAACTALLFWPIFTFVCGAPNDRNFYEVSIPFILTFVALFKFTSLKKYYFARYCGACLLILLTAFNLFFLAQKRKYVFNYLESSFLPILELKKASGETLQDTPLFIFNLPLAMYHWMSLPQALELNGINRVAIDCYCDSRVRIFGSVNDLLVKIDVNSFRFISDDKEKLWFTYEKPFFRTNIHDDFPFGRHSIYVYNKDNCIMVPFQEAKIYDIEFIFKEKEYYHPDAKFLTWDYENNKFIVLNNLIDCRGVCGANI